MIELVRAGRTPESLSREFEPSAQAIHNWVRQADRDEGRRDDGATSAERQELVHPRRENKRFCEERAVWRSMFSSDTEWVQSPRVIDEISAERSFQSPFSWTQTFVTA